ncbi:hypothetical protein [Spirosoma koreense]
MYIDFDKLSDQARIWVYQANRPLTDGDVNTIEAALQPALNQWAAHGQPLLASAQVVENRFVIIGVDEEYSLPSGCSIDSFVRIMQDMGRQLSSGPVDFFDRSAVILLPDGTLEAIALTGLKAAVATNALTPETTVFNTLVKTKTEFAESWHIRAADSWLKRYFKPVTATAN